jgi:hypothetical protein
LLGKDLPIQEYDLEVRREIYSLIDSCTCIVAALLEVSKTILHTPDEEETQGLGDEEGRRNHCIKDGDSNNPIISNDMMPMESITKTKVLQKCNPY